MNLLLMALVLPIPPTPSIPADTSVVSAARAIDRSGSTVQGKVPSGDQAAPIDDRVTTSETGATNAGEVILQWPAEVQLDVEATDYEIVVRFDHPLSDEEFNKFAADAGAKLADLRWNDDSLVMRPAPGYRIGATVNGNSLRVEFIAEGSTVSESSPTDEADSAKELAIVRAQADVASGYPGMAIGRLTRLSEQYPEDKQIQRALADAHAANGETATAARGYRTIGADDLAAQRIIAASNGRTTGAFILRDGKTFSQWEAGLVAEVRLQDAILIGSGIRHLRTVAQDVAAPTGYLTKISSQLTIVDLTANLTAGPSTRLVLQASALTDQDVIGVGVKLSFGPLERQLRLVAAYRLPDASTAEQAIFGGHVSRVGGGGTIRIAPNIAVFADASWNDYGLAGGGGRTSTFQATGGFDYMLRRQSPSMQLSYRLDAEYPDRQQTRANGIPFIPLSRRENHTLQGIVSIPISKAQLTAAAGWTKDRFGGNGPTASVGTVANLGNLWRLEATGGISSISRQAISGRNYYVSLSITRSLGIN